MFIEWHHNNILLNSRLCMANSISLSYIYILLFIYIWNYIVFKWIDKLLNNCLINDATTTWNHTNQGLKTWFIGLKKLLFYYLIEQDSLWIIPNIPKELTKNVTYGKYCIIIILWWIISFLKWSIMWFCKISLVL